jgi:hypothetical protein
MLVSQQRVAFAGIFAAATGWYFWAVRERVRNVASIMVDDTAGLAVVDKTATFGDAI